MLGTLMPETPTITVTSASVQTASIATDMNAIAPQNTISLRKAMDDLSNALGTPQKLLHGGMVTVKGVNNKNELVATVEQTIYKNMEQGSRRVVQGLTTLPSPA